MGSKDSVGAGTVVGVAVDVGGSEAQDTEAAEISSTAASKKATGNRCSFTYVPYTFILFDESISVTLVLRIGRKAKSVAARLVQQLLCTPGHRALAEHEGLDPQLKLPPELAGHPTLQASVRRWNTVFLDCALPIWAGFSQTVRRSL